MGLRLKIPRISQDVSTTKENVQQAGTIGRAMQGLGQAVADTGMKVGSIVKRREEEKRKSDISLKKRQYEANLRAKSKALKLEYQNDPDKAYSEYGKFKEKLSNEYTKNVTDQETLQRLNAEKSIVDITYDTDFETYRNMRNIEISKETIDEVSESNAIQLRETPYYNPDGSAATNEAHLLLKGQIMDIMQRDMSIESKNKLIESSSKKIIMGAINGYMKDSNTKGLRAFSNAEKFVNELNLGSNQSQRVANKDRYLAIIRNRRLQYINEKASRNNANKKLIQKQFQREIIAMREAVNMKIQNPNADVGADYRKLFRMGVISGPNKAMSRDQMDEHKAYRSRTMLMGILENMSETPNKFSKRKQIYDAYFRGHLAAEDADIALNSLETDMSKKYNRYQVTESNRILKKKASSGITPFGSNIIDPELYIKFATMRDNLVRDRGIPPITAARMIIRKEGNSVIQNDARRALRILDPELRLPKLENVEMAKKKIVEEFKKAKGDPKKVKRLERQFDRLLDYEEDLKNDQISPEFMKIMDEVTGVKGGK